MPSPDRELDLERHRDYLTVLARMGLPRKLRRRLAASDIVQQTLLEAHVARPAFRGRTFAEQAAWLRGILTNNIVNAVRDHGRDCRDVDRECSLERRVEQSSVRLDAWLAAKGPSPSEAAQREERTRDLVRGLAQLDDTALEVFLLRHVHEWSLSAIAERMDTSRYHVTQTLRRTATRLMHGLRKHQM